MISHDLARRLNAALRDAGVVWTPAQGDRFWLPEHDLDDVDFLVSDMVVEVRKVGDGGRVLAFNGTTEWALDSIETDLAVWLPREDQLRDLLGARFERLERLHTPTGPAYAVVAGGVRFVDVAPADAYARALLE